MPSDGAGASNASTVQTRSKRASSHAPYQRTTAAATSASLHSSSDSPNSNCESPDVQCKDIEFDALGRWYVPAKGKNIVLHLNREKWLEAIILQANRGKVTNGDIFRFCAATIQAGGGNLASISLSKSSIRLKRIAFNAKVAQTIKVNILLSMKIITLDILHIN